MCKECGCEAPHEHGRFHVRRFLKKEEKIEKLESYVEELKKELAAVEERVKELKSQ